ncbi:MAG: hypothetical protein PHI35_09300, partial [Victivallaceae bacterium]|nr:hypothetical protein [Victivallaceae bacterium]
MAEKTANYARVLGCVNTDLRFKCPECGQHFQGDRAGYAGATLTCTRCGASFIVPVVRPPEIPSPAGGEIPCGDLICPHCWKSFDPAYLLAIASHPSLVGDPVVGEFEQKRFEPLVFDVEGTPLDECGFAAPDSACPVCHLRIPRVMLDLPERYYSIVGAPASGKSFFLTSLVHRLKTFLPERFGMTLIDADPVMNSTLNYYEKTLFMPLDPEKVATLPKTQPTGGAFSDRITLGGLAVELPKPFIFECRSPQKDFNLVFYDNAGEQFEPGTDGALNPGTHHLSRSDGIIFVFDPTHDAIMRAGCDPSDPQTSENAKIIDQSELLAEMVGRIRKLSNLGS